VEMTRKRVREDLVQLLSEPCEYCEGKGYHKSRSTIAFEIFRQIKREVATSDGRNIYLTVHPSIADLLYSDFYPDLSDLEGRLRRRVIVTPSDEFHIEKYTVEVR